MWQSRDDMRQSLARKYFIALIFAKGGGAVRVLYLWLFSRCLSFLGLLERMASRQNSRTGADTASTGEEQSKYNLSWVDDSYTAPPTFFKR